MKKEVSIKVPRDARTLVILLLGSLVSIPVTLMLSGDIEITYIIGLALGVITALIYLKNRRNYKIVLGVVLLIGSMDFAKFIPFDFTISSSITLGLKFAVTFQVFSFILLLSHLYFNREPLMNLVAGIFREKQLTEEELNHQRELRIESFKSKYSQKSISELTRISNSTGTFDQNAIEAAVRLLKERNAR